MGVAASLVVFAVGAIMRFAVKVSSSSFNIHEVGVILMIIAAVGFVVSLVCWSSWGGFGGSNRRAQTTVSSPQGTTTTRTDEHIN
jgi:hypothetical protein